MTQPQTESSTDAHLAEERIFDTRSEPYRAKGCEFLENTLRIDRAKDGLCEDETLPRSIKLGYRTNVRWIAHRTSRVGLVIRRRRWLLRG